MTGHRRIGFLVYDGFDLMDLAGPAEVFKFCEVHLRLSGCRSEPRPRLDYFSLDGGLVTAAQGLTVETRPSDEIPGCALDTIIVVGSFHITDACDPRLPQLISQCVGKVRRIAAVCTGAFVLAHAGLLDGRRAVTHFSDCDLLASRFPKVEVDAECIFLEDGDVWTSAGVTAGIDMALAMVEQDYGPDRALRIARSMVVFLKRPAGQAQVSTQLRAQSVSGPIGELLRWISNNPAADLRAEALADRANMSLRNFYRAFEDATRTSPALWVETVRLELAKRLLEETEDYAEQVALRSGFGTYERMRRSFVKRLGVSPLAYRGRRQQPLVPPVVSIEPAPAWAVSATGPAQTNALASHRPRPPDRIPNPL